MNNNTTDNPWRGLAPYDGYENPGLFCGRKEEIKHLRKLIEDNVCVVFYGASGVGKTSLLKAGVMPILRLYNYQPIHIRLSETAPNVNFAQKIVDSLYDFDNDKKNEELKTDQRVRDSSESWYLWKYFCTTRFFDTSREVVPVIILDQFEEVFRGDDRNRTELLLLQIYALLNGSLTLPQGYDDSKNYRFVISMREDFLFALEDCIDRMGLNRLKNARFRLRPLNIEQAKQVVSVCPDLLPPKEEEREDVIKALVNSSIQDGEVSSLLLSLICYRAYELKKGTVIDMDTIKELGEKSLKKFCDEILKDVDQKAFDFIVNKTIDDNGFRLPVGSNALLSNNVPRRLWDDKNAKRLFVKTSRKGIGADSADLYYELLHDQLALAILDYRKEIEKEIEVRAERKKKVNWLLIALADKACSLIEQGDSYLARILTLDVLTLNLENPNTTYVLAKEYALRRAEYALRISQCSNNAILREHGNWVFTVAISSDDKWIVSGSHDETIRVWEKASGNCRFVLKGHKGIVNCVQISSDCKYIVSAGDKSIKMWSLETGEFYKDIAKYDTFVSGIAISPDNSYIYSALQNGAMKKYDKNTGECVLSFDGHTKYINSISISHNGKLIVSTAGDDTVKIWNVSTGKIVQDIKMTSPESAFFNSNDTKLITSAFDGNVRIYDVASGKLLLIFSVGAILESAIYSPTDKYILTADFDGNIIVWNAQNGEKTHVFKGHTAPVDTIIFSPDGKALISSARDNTIRIWDFNINEKQKRRRGLFYVPPVNVSKAVFTSKGNIIASYWDKTIKLWNSNATICEHVFKGHTSPVGSFCLSPDERNLASVSSDKTIRIWDCNSGKEEKLIWDNARELDSVSFSPDGKLLMASCDETIKIWNTDNYELVKTLSGHQKWIYHAIFSQDGKYIISGSYDKSIKIWNVKTGELVKTLSGHTDAVRHVAVYQSGDDMLIASSSSDSTVRLWNGNTGELLNILDGHKHVVQYVSFSSDGRYLLSTSTDIRVWDAGTGEILDILEGHDDLINSVEFSPDTKTILSASSDGTIKLWSFPSLQDLIDSTRERFRNRQLTNKERKKYYLE